MKLDPDLQAIADAMAAKAPAEPILDPAALRRAVEAGPSLGRTTPVARAQDLTLPGPAGPLRARLYAPTSLPAPLLVFLHGGGFVMCSIDTHDNLCRALAAEAGHAILSVDYRLAPEHRFPAALDDAVAAAIWAAANTEALGCRPGPIAIGGDSAGGDLAVGAAMALRDRGVGLSHLLLIYPALDPACAGPSYAEHPRTPFLDADTMRWFWSLYLAAEGDYVDPRAAPLRADLTGLPPTTLISAEHDPINSDGEAFLKALAAAGGRFEARRFAGPSHGFASLVGLVEKADAAATFAAARLRHSAPPQIGRSGVAALTACDPPPRG